MAAPISDFGMVELFKAEKVGNFKSLRFALERQDTVNNREATRAGLDGRAV